MSELDRLYERIDRGFEQMNDRLDELNGRTRTAEQKIAVLEDRGIRVRDNPARWAGGIAIVGGLVAEAVKRVWGGHP